MKTTLGILAFAVVLASSTSLYAECNLLTLDVSDPNEAFICNATDAVIEFDSFYIGSLSGMLDPDAYYGLHARQVDQDYIWLLDNFGIAGLGFSLTSATTSLIAELHLGGCAQFQPGFCFSIGNACPNGSLADLTFCAVPEPATMGLLALGGFFGLRRRR